MSDISEEVLIFYWVFKDRKVRISMTNPISVTHQILRASENGVALGRIDDEEIRFKIVDIVISN